MHDDVEENAPPPPTHNTLPESNGCKCACLFHLVLLGALLTVLTMWIIRNKAWELEITVEMNDQKKASAPKPADEKAADDSGKKSEEK